MNTKLDSEMNNFNERMKYTCFKVTYMNTKRGILNRSSSWNMKTHSCSKNCSQLKRELMKLSKGTNVTKKLQLNNSKLTVSVIDKKEVSFKPKFLNFNAHSH